MFDLVLPVYNSLNHVRGCLESIIKYSTKPYHLYLCDDNSTPFVKAEITKLLTKIPIENYTIISNKINLGYLKNCNQGILAGKNPYVVLINSDTLMSEGYLERLEEVFLTDAKIGIVNPVSCWANWTRVPFPQGETVTSLAARVKDLGAGQISDINNASGFFFATRRAVFDEVGVFDEKYGFGYWEETDLCMRALEAKYRVVVDHSLFIFHHGWGSFGEGGRNEQLEKNAKIFMASWELQYQKILAGWKQTNPLASLIQKLELPARKIKAETYQQCRQIPLTIADAALALDCLRYQTKDALPALYSRPKKLPSSNSAILYVLPAVAFYGGIVSVFQLVNNMIRLGLNANIAIYGPVDEKFYKMFPIYFRPYLFENLESMVANFPDASLIVATHWETSFAVKFLSELRGLPCAYFVQDFEPDFYSDVNQHLREQAMRTYKIISNKIVKTAWLGNKLKEFSGEVRRIPLGLNLDIFHASGLPEKARRIIGYARPSSPYRNFTMLQKVYSELYKQDPTIELAVYGIGYSANDFDVPVIDYGRVEDMNKMAQILNEATVLLDCSTFQGFGRPGLEAMACGAACVLTREGGITEYAKHRYNCLLIEPDNLEQIITSVFELLNNSELRTALVQEGRLTAESFSDQIEAETTARYFLELIESHPKN